VRAGSVGAIRRRSGTTRTRADPVESGEPLLRFEAALKPTSSLSIVVKDHLVRGTSELREVDPGGETTFGLVPFLLQEPEVDFTMDWGAGRASPSFRGTRPSGSATRERPPFSTTGAGVWRLATTTNQPASVLYGFVNFEATDEQREQGSLQNVTSSTRAIGWVFAAPSIRSS